MAAPVRGEDVPGDQRPVAEAATWHDPIVDAGAGGILVSAGYGQPLGERWDRARGRRFLVLSYVGTVLLTVGLLMLFRTLAGVAVMCIGGGVKAIAKRNARLAMGLSRVELWGFPSYGRIYDLHPISVARRHERGNWWEALAWVALGLQITAVIAGGVLVVQLS